MVDSADCYSESLIRPAQVAAGDPGVSMRRRRSRGFQLRDLVLVAAVIFGLQQGGAAALLRVANSAVSNVSEGVAAVRGEAAPDTAEEQRPLPTRNERRARAAKKATKVKRSPHRQPARAAEVAWQVSNVVDGDTLTVVGPNGKREDVR